MEAKKEGNEKSEKKDEEREEKKRRERVRKAVKVISCTGGSWRWRRLEH